jgi:hypothetical protein
MRALSPWAFFRLRVLSGQAHPAQLDPRSQKRDRGTLRFTLPHFLKSLGDQGAYDVFQVAEAGGDAFYWRDFSGAEFYVLFYDHPAGIGVLL